MIMDLVQHFINVLVIHTVLRLITFASVYKRSLDLKRHLSRRIVTPHQFTPTQTHRIYIQFLIIHKRISTQTHSNRLPLVLLFFLLLLRIHSHSIFSIIAIGNTGIIHLDFRLSAIAHCNTIILLNRIGWLQLLVINRCHHHSLHNRLLLRPRSIHQHIHHTALCLQLIYRQRQTAQTSSTSLPCRLRLFLFLLFLFVITNPQSIVLFVPIQLLLLLFRFGFSGIG
mmetsp:Transcript_69794/g.110942  ORF Transcript_69794/g.110942 Transcript_69794/m.110942 type:complete len:226 (-) Transcript_69794:367-1044(-)